MLFSKKPESATTNRHPSFSYLGNHDYYFDSACQTLRPQEVIDAETAYYREYNACGGRVKYKWGQRVDEQVIECRELLLKYFGLSHKEFVAAFTLNTTYGMNMVLWQLPWEKFTSIVTTDIEHNSVFLPSQTIAKRFDTKRIVVNRRTDGGVDISSLPSEPIVFVANAVSNIDGRTLANLKEIYDHVHQYGGIVILDIAQAGAHKIDELFCDVACGSAHKMYAPSLGFVLIRKTVLEALDIHLIGGGTVEDVTRDSFELIKTADDPVARLELGLQNWAGIVGLLEALRWRIKFRHDGQSAEDYERTLTSYLSEKLRGIPNLHNISPEGSPIQSVYAEKKDAHNLALYLGEKGIMCRSGYFCCHSYLKHQMKYPPLLRISLGLHNTKADVDVLVQALARLVV